MNQPQAKSVYAGETIKGAAYIVQEDGTAVEKEFTVAIPKDATNAEMSEISSQAARETVGLTSVTRGIAERRQFARSENSDGGNTMTIKPSSSGATKMCAGTVPAASQGQDWNYVEINFFNVLLLDKLNVRIVNGALPSNSADRNCYQTINVSDNDFIVYFYAAKTYGSGKCTISSGATMSVYASSGTTSTGYAACIAYVGSY